MRVRLSGVEISIDGRAVGGETEIAASGAYSTVVTTVLEQPAVLLVCSYVIDLSGQAAAIDLWRASQGPEFHHRDLQLGGVAIARACLLDHSARLRELLAGERDAATVTVEISEDALGLTERIWDSTSPET